MSHNTEFSFVATTRTETGKRPMHRLRRQNKVPGIIYGANEASTPITLEHREVHKALNHEAVYSHILTLNVDNKKAEKVVLKAVERHATKPQIMHIDFQRVRADEKITMRVPLHFLNEENCPGVKAGGIISHLMNDLEIKCLPDNLPEYINVDAAQLQIDSSIHLSEISLPKGVELTQEVDEDHNPTVMSIHKPRAEVEPVAAAETVEGEEPTAAEESAEQEKAQKE